MLRRCYQAYFVLKNPMTPTGIKPRPTGGEKLARLSLIHRHICHCKNVITLFITNLIMTQHVYFGKYPKVTLSWWFIVLLGACSKPQTEVDKMLEQIIESISWFNCFAHNLEICSFLLVPDESLPSSRIILYSKFSFLSWRWYDRSMHPFFDRKIKPISPNKQRRYCAIIDYVQNYKHTTRSCRLNSFI